LFVAIYADQPGLGSRLKKSHGMPRKTQSAIDDHASGIAQSRHYQIDAVVKQHRVMDG
jgi:hypothetical protein